MLTSIENMYNIIGTFEEWGTPERLFHCNASVLTGYITVKRRGCTETMGVYMLRSYSTLVAMIVPATNTLYVFGYYSATTSQHVAKFAHEYHCCWRKKYYLYQRSDHTGYYEDTYLKYSSSERKQTRKTYTEIKNNIEI